MGTYLFDQYSLLHAAVGIVLYFFGISFVNTILVHTLFEIAENTEIGMNFINNYFTFWPGGKPHADTLTNIIGDTVSISIGWFLARFVDRIADKYKLYV